MAGPCLRKTVCPKRASLKVCDIPVFVSILSLVSSTLLEQTKSMKSDAERFCGPYSDGRNFSQNEFLQNSGSVSTPPISTSSTTQESAKEDEVAPPTLQTLVPAGPLSLDPAPDVRSSPSSVSTQLTLAAVPLPPAVQSKLPQNRRATFAQNLSVHSTWPPALYDRRGEPATCNRLTPTLAQRIKVYRLTYLYPELRCDRN